MSRANHAGTAAGGLACILGLVGCSLVPPYVPPDVPAEIQVIMDDPGAFTLPADLAPDPNTPPIADADGLTGCWGRSFVDEELNVALPGTRALDLRTGDLWRFDAAAGTVQYEMYARDEPSGMVLLQIISGTFELREPGVVAVRFDTFGINDWRTGGMHYEPPPEGPVPETLVHIEVEGDYLFLLGSDEAGNADADLPWVFLRFDCL